VKERERAEQEWFEARMKWAAEQLEGGVWKCPTCEAVVRLSKQEEAGKAAVRCTGAMAGLSGKGGTNHWPMLMERIGDIVWESESEPGEEEVS
jgi:hypothetical protein